MMETFDPRAETWDDEPRRVRLARMIFAAIEQTVPLRSDAVALDYGCGTGLLTLPLAAHVQQVIAVDTSSGMIHVLKQKVEAQGIGNIEPRQTDPSATLLPSGPYDLITSAMTLHHVADTRALLQQFFGRLAPEGRLAIADLDTEDGTFHGHPEGIHHLGFDRADLAQQLATCGFKKVQFTTATQIEKNEKTYPVFLVTAQKPQT